MELIAAVKMKQLIHNGVLIPPYEAKGFAIGIRGQIVHLTPEQEEMAVAFCKQPEERLSDPVFVENFLHDFRAVLGVDESYSLEDFDFTEIERWLEEEKTRKVAMSKEERKKLSEMRKRVREENKLKYGYAIVDGKRIETNYLVEPPCIYAGRGKHPLRGRWKSRVYYSDVVLNLSPDAPTPPTPDGTEWGGREWDPDGLWIAKWRDKLTGKMKYVWLSHTAPPRQRRDIEKYNLAKKLAKRYEEVKEKIEGDLASGDLRTRQIATAVYLIDRLRLRVGDEKDPEETLDTVGVTTLRKQDVKIRSSSRVEFDFLGKGAVKFHKTVELPEQVIRNLQDFISTSPGDRIFPNLRSEVVNKYLSSIMPGLTSKVFRTYHATEAVRRVLQKYKVSPSAPEFKKLYIAKLANLEAAKELNHRRKLPESWEKQVEKQRKKVEEIEAEIKRLSCSPRTQKKLKKLKLKLYKTKLKLRLMQKMGDYNLSTSLNNYIDPRVFIKWAKQKSLDWMQLYPKSLQMRFKWALYRG